MPPVHRAVAVGSAPVLGTADGPCTTGMLGKVANPMKWNQLLYAPKEVRRLSLFAGYLAGETCSVYAIFIAHTMNPVSYRLVEDNRKLRVIYGRYQEIFNWDGPLFTLVGLVVFALAWCVVRAIAEAIATPGFVPYPMDVAQLPSISEEALTLR
jgi:hypothetical protein